MKGRYKLRTKKWEFKAAIEREARELLRKRSEKQIRFLDAACAASRSNPSDQPSSPLL